MALRPQSQAFTFLIAGLAALPPLSIDMSLPAATPIGEALHAPPSQTGLTLSLFMLGFALAQLGFGPVSDRFGRWAPLVTTLAIFTIAGLFCGLAGSIDGLLFWRFFEGAGAGGATVLAFAMVRDLFAGVEARARMSTITATMTVAPMLAPSVGALILRFAEWRVIFLALALAGLALTLAVVLSVNESHPAKDSSALAPAKLLRNYARAFQHRSALGHSLLGALCFGCLFSFVSGSPYVFIGVLGLGTGAYALLFAICALGLTAGSLLCGRLVNAGFDPRRMLASAVLGQTAFALVLLGVALSGQFSVASALPLLILNNLAMGFVNPLSVHGAMEPFPDMAGVASAVRGFLQMLGGAAASALVARLFTGTATALPLSMAIFAVMSSLIWVTLLRPGVSDAAPVQHDLA
jgi:DHA1 family bicyclomycin/chloramphenicol resistance-like MFS transporter